MLIVAQQRMQDTMPELEQANIAVENHEKESGICDGNSVGRGDATGAADTAHGIPLTSCKGHRELVESPA